jgi:hypothetical protein
VNNRKAIKVKKQALVASILSLREAKLCMQTSCTTGCIGIFRKTIKEALTGHTIETEDFWFLSPSQRAEIRKFIRTETVFLTTDEQKFLEIFCNEPNPSIPSEAAALKLIRERQAEEDKLRLARFKDLVVERRAVKREIIQERHRQRLAKKKERDHIYWVAYWAARHSMQDLQRDRSVSNYSNRRFLFFFLSSIAFKIKSLLLFLKKS